ncbi:hypothetical protein JCM3765_005792 [Sporobolomyces pararoseus]
MSFSSLPPELVHQIIESAVPHIFHSATYTERQSTLCSLSLVSKLFHSIAQPLLPEIVHLNRREVVPKLNARALGRGMSSFGSIRWLLMEWHEWWDDERTQEEHHRFTASSQVLEAVTKLAAANIAQRNLENLLSATSHHLTYLQLTEQYSETPQGLHLPNLRYLTLFDVSSELFVALVEPQTVPKLRHFAFVDNDPFFVNDLTESRLNRLLPQLNTLTLSSSVWLDPGSTSLHSVASRTLVDFQANDVTRLDDSAAPLVHIRLGDLYLKYSPYGQKELHVHLDKWITFIRDQPKLSLKSVYLDSSLQRSDATPSATQFYLEALTRVCQERKIDVVFEALRSNLDLDPYISSEFIQRQEEGRRRGSQGGGTSRA